MDLLALSTAYRSSRPNLSFWLFGLAGMAIGTLAPAAESQAASDQTISRSVASLGDPGAPPRMVVERGVLAPGVPAPLDAQGRSLTDVAGGSYRWWVSHGRGQIGLGVGAVGMVAPFREGASPALRTFWPEVSVGWRYQMSNATTVYADARGGRGFAPDAMPGLYSAQMGMEWQPAKSSLGFEGRSLGLQLQSGYRMSLRLKSGGMGLYFRGKF